MSEAGERNDPAGRSLVRKRQEIKSELTFLAASLAPCALKAQREPVFRLSVSVL